jgi:hypothetical protein
MKIVMMNMITRIYMITNESYNPSTKGLRLMLKKVE